MLPAHSRPYSCSPTENISTLFFPIYYLGGKSCNFNPGLKMRLPSRKAREVLDAGWYNLQMQIVTHEERAGSASSIIKVGSDTQCLAIPVFWKGAAAAQGGCLLPGTSPQTDPHFGGKRGQQQNASSAFLKSHLLLLDSKKECPRLAISAPGRNPIRTQIG